jgi:hypothetical protein
VIGVVGSWQQKVVKMAQKFDFVDWWSKEQHRGTPVVVKMENPNYSLLEIESPKSSFTTQKDKGKNAKQLTWVLLLKAHKAAGFVAWIGSGVMILLGAIKKRLILGQGLAQQDKSKGKLFKAITAFLFFAVIMLCVEVGAHALGWHFTVPHWPPSVGIEDIPHAVYVGWMYFRANYIAPALQKLTNFCIGLFLLQSVDRIVLFIGCVYIRWKDIKPIPVNPSLESEDPENPDSGHPMVLVQIPMCNEREVCADLKSLFMHCKQRIFYFFYKLLIFLSILRYWVNSHSLFSPFINELRFKTR